MFHKWKIAREIWLLPVAIAGIGPAAAAPATVPTPVVSEPKTIMVPRAVPVPKKAPPKPVVQDYEPRPAMWLVADEDTKIYLFGTFHILPPGFKWRSPVVERTAKEADELVVETYDAPGTRPDPKFLQQLFLEKPVPILDRVPAEYRKPLQQAIEKAGLPPQRLAMLRTWTAAMALGLGEQLSAWGADGPSDAPGVEDALEAEFRESGKPIGSVETPETALAALNALTEEQQVELLLEGLEPKPRKSAEDRSGEDDRSWALGRFDEIYKSFVRDMPPVLYEGLVRKRNAAWTLWIEERMRKPGTVLFAVGAGHLAGKDSVQKMLGKRGIKTRRID